MRIAIYAAKNKHGKKDATHAFIPEAKRFAEVGLRMPIDTHRANRVRRSQTIDFLDTFDGEVTHVGIFAHGWRTGMQFGFNTKNIMVLCEALEKAAACDDLIVTMYCCSTGQGRHGGDNSFADHLRDGLCRVGLTHCRVDAHTTKGHTTRNPYVRRFEGLGTPNGGAGGSYIISPGNRRLFRKWRAALRSDMRFEFPTLSRAEIIGELEGDVS